MPLLHSGRDPLRIESIPHANGHSAGARRLKCHFKPLVFNVSTFPSVCAGFGVVRSARYRFDHWSKHVNWPFRGGRRGPTACPNCTKLGIRVEETRRGQLGRFEPKATLHMPLLQSVRDPLSIESAPHDAGGQALGARKPCLYRPVSAASLLPKRLTAVAQSALDSSIHPSQQC